LPFKKANLVTNTADEVERGINLHIKDPNIHSFESAYEGVTGICKYWNLNNNILLPLLNKEASR
jgi:hypothetical protein